MVGIILTVALISVPSLFAKRCPTCGQKNPLEARTCRVCGEIFPAEEP